MSSIKDYIDRRNSLREKDFRMLYGIFDDFRHKLLNAPLEHLDEHRFRALALQLAALACYVSEKYNNFTTSRLKLICQFIDVTTPDQEEIDRYYADLSEEQGS